MRHARVGQDLGEDDWRQGHVAGRQAAVELLDVVAACALKYATRSTGIDRYHSGLREVRRDRSRTCTSRAAFAIRAALASARASEAGAHSLGDALPVSSCAQLEVVLWNLHGDLSKFAHAVTHTIFEAGCKAGLRCQHDCHRDRARECESQLPHHHRRARLRQNLDHRGAARARFSLRRRGRPKDHPRAAADRRQCASLGRSREIPRADAVALDGRLRPGRRERRAGVLRSRHSGARRVWSRSSAFRRPRM